MGVARDCNSNIYCGPNTSPDETRDQLSVVGQDLERESQRVDVWAVVA